MQKKQFSATLIEFVMMDEEDILTSSKHHDTTRAEETTANPVDTADDLPWDTMG